MDKGKIVELLVSLLSEKEANNETPVVSGVEQGKWKIVILQRGWIYVGRYFENGNECWLEDASCIRTWGTSKGLGELAKKGALSGTKLDECPIVRFHKLGIVCTIDCNEDKWK